jgi:hypothetical protein
MSKSFGTAFVVLVILLVWFMVGTPLAEPPQQLNGSGLTGEMKSLTALVGPSTDEVLLSIPTGFNFVMTQLCRSTGTGSDFRLHNVGGGGSNSQATLDNTECQEYEPGLVFYGTDDVVFRNNNGSLTIRVVANGVLTKK